jgi:hypothetical protein
MHVSLRLPNASDKHSLVTTICHRRGKSSTSEYTFTITMTEGNFTLVAANFSRLSTFCQWQQSALKPACTQQLSAGLTSSRWICATQWIPLLHTTVVGWRSYSPFFRSRQRPRLLPRTKTRTDRKGSVPQNISWILYTESSVAVSNELC